MPVRRPAVEGARGARRPGRRTPRYRFEPSEPEGSGGFLLPGEPSARDAVPPASPGREAREPGCDQDRGRGLGDGRDGEARG